MTGRTRVESLLRELAMFVAEHCAWEWLGERGRDPEWSTDEEAMAAAFDDIEELIGGAYRSDSALNLRGAWWPCYDDGTPVRLGDLVTAPSYDTGGRVVEVWEVAVRRGCATLSDGNGNQTNVSAGGTVERYRVPGDDSWRKLEDSAGNARERALVMRALALAGKVGAE